jgi:hypothetical protein
MAIGACTPAAPNNLLRWRKSTLIPVFLFFTGRDRVRSRYRRYRGPGAGHNRDHRAARARHLLRGLHRNCGKPCHPVMTQPGKESTTPAGKWIGAYWCRPPRDDSDSPRSCVVVAALLVQATGMRMGCRPCRQQQPGTHQTCSILNQKPH